MRERIQMRCGRCGNAMLYPRSVDTDLPRECCFIESSLCNLCDDGDFGNEVLLDASRKEIVPEWASE